MKYYFILFFCFNVNIIQAQKQNNVWLFSGNIFLNFNKKPPLSKTSEKLIPDINLTYSAISDNQGNLLLATNGATVWGKDTISLEGNPIHPIGEFENGRTSGLITPKPLSKNLYYIFTTFGNPGGKLEYGLVDMNLNNGKGAIVSKKVPLWGGNSGIYEDLLVTGGENCNDIWVICREFSYDRFISFHITATGIDTVISKISNIIPIYNLYNSQEAIISPDGSKIAVSPHDKTGITLYNFDKKTGLVSPSGIEFTNTNRALNFTFSTDSKKFYYTEEEPDKTDPLYKLNFIYGYDISSFNQEKINASFQKWNIYRTRIPNDYTDINMLLGPNGNIYLLVMDYGNALTIGKRIYLDEMVGTNLGQSLTIKKDVVYLGTNKKINDREYFFRFNYLRNYYEHLPKLVLPNKFCTGDSITLKADTAYASTRYKWFVNDSLISTAAQPKIKLNKVGKQNITLHINECLVEQDIEVSPSLVPILKDTSLCEAQLISLTATNNGSKYLWNTKDTTQTITLSKGGKYKVAVSNTCNQILDSASVKLHPKFYDFLNPITEVCEQDQITLSAPIGAEIYKWSTEETTPNITISQAGKYQVQLANRCYALSDSTEVVFFNEIFKTTAQNLITANEDGKNDELILFEHDLKNYTLSIYNRWGARVFQSHNSLEKWKPNEVEAGVYYYSVTADYCNGNQYEQKGWVEVVK